VLGADGKISGRNVGGLVHRGSICVITCARIQAGFGETCGWLGAGGFCGWLGGICGQHGGICGRLGARIVQRRHCCGPGTVVGGVVGAGVCGLQLLGMTVSVSSSSLSSVRT
jgi:hypothetical protein